MWSALLMAASWYVEPVEKCDMRTYRESMDTEWKGGAVASLSRTIASDTEARACAFHLVVTRLRRCHSQFTHLVSTWSTRP